MNEELIRQCAREAANGPHGYAHEIAERAIRLYDVRAVQPLRRENEELRALVKDLNEQARRDGERIGGLEARMAELTEALEPFALIAEMDIGDDETDADLFRPLTHNYAPRITVGHLRAALKALAAFGDVSVQKAHTPTLAPEVRALVEAAMEARRIAMEQTVAARVPECGKFGDIAQDLDAALAAFEKGEG